MADLLYLFAGVNMLRENTKCRFHETLLWLVNSEDFNCKYDVLDDSVNA